MKRSPVVALIGIGAAAWWITRGTRSNFSFASKSVLITGGSRGLGLTMARQLAREGARVALLARDETELRRAAAQLRELGSEAVTVACDLNDREQTAAAARQVLERFGGIDVLINNAGIIQVGPLRHMQREDFERAMAVHFWAPFTMMEEIVPHMRARGGGRIVNITSIGGRIAVPHFAPYSASKFALVGLSDACRAELARDGIHITTVAPGLMRTGSHVNAKFKGDYGAEFTWFAVSAGMPLVSMNAERAARKIIAACRRGQPSLTLTVAAGAAIAGNAVLPNLTGQIMKLVSRFLPAPKDGEGDELTSGWQARAEQRAPAWLTRLADRAIAPNNEARRA